MANYRGADAFKHGYTRASGYSGVSSAVREMTLITVVFGGRSIAARNKQMAKLSDLGFKLLLTK